MARQINDRSDVCLLVHSFYDKVRKDELLGPIFTRHIATSQWAEHLEMLTNFWMMNLLNRPGFKGSPSQKHINVDRASGFTIEQKHFGKWLQLWFETIDELFEGEIAVKAKETARRMAHSQFLTIWENRPKEDTSRSLPKI
jgi:hemoglobin